MNKLSILSLSVKLRNILHIHIKTQELFTASVALGLKGRVGYETYHFQKFVVKDVDSEIAEKGVGVREIYAWFEQVFVFVDEVESREAFIVSSDGLSVGSASLVETLG